GRSRLGMWVGIGGGLWGAVQEPSGLRVTATSVAKPASASSMALSTTSYTIWWRPDPSSVSPIYMPGRLRTASRPLRTLIDSASYSDGFLRAGSAISDTLESGEKMSRNEWLV